MSDKILNVLFLCTDGDQVTRMMTFRSALRETENRIKIFASLPIDSLDRLKLQQYLERIGINGFGRMGRLGLRAGWGRTIEQLNSVCGPGGWEIHLTETAWALTRLRKVISGRPRGMVGYSLDISEQKHREQELARLVQKLRAANKESVIMEWDLICAMRTNSLVHSSGCIDPATLQEPEWASPPSSASSTAMEARSGQRPGRERVQHSVFRSSRIGTNGNRFNWLARAAQRLPEASAMMPS
jgi:hypothetical protein